MLLQGSVITLKDETMSNTRTFKAEELRILQTYRYLSWLLTSLYYYFTDSTSHWIYKLAVIFLIYVSARITIATYNRFDRNEKFEKSFVFAETIGISLIIFPTGGLNSPFIWYALNPVLISANFLSYYFCWFNLICYLSASTMVLFLFFNPKDEGLYTIISRYSHLILIFVLITLAAQLLAKLNNKLRKQSLELLEANDTIQESMEQIMSLYQTVEAIISQDNKSDMYQTFADYTAKLTRADCAFFWYKPNDTDSNMIFISKNTPKDTIKELVCCIENALEKYLFCNEIIKINIGDNNYFMAAVQSTSNSYGLVGFRNNNCTARDVNKEYINQLRFISDLSAIILERFHLEEVTGRLMIAEEQNRIADEMHDSVSQRLFSITCAVHTIMEGWDKTNKKQLQEKLIFLQEAAHSAMKELRSTIYKLSSRKGGQKSFESGVKEYLYNISRMNNIDINLDINGDEQLINITIKRGLYRIVCEATGNAIRHGMCSKISIKLIIEENLIKLNISDNGRGFILNDIDNKGDRGLGLYNMKRIVGLFDGEIHIDSELGKGTTINISLPNGNKIEKVKGA